jgi:hypothetical protein
MLVAASVRWLLTGDEWWPYCIIHVQPAGPAPGFFAGNEAARLRGNMPVSQIHPLMLVAGQSASIQVRQIEKVSTLADVEFRICSQFGEDGIIEWLVHRLDIDTPSFVEIGASNYDEANTRFLLENRNWRGLLIDADPRISELRNSLLWWRQDISAIQSFVSAENIDSLISRQISAVK